VRYKKTEISSGYRVDLLVQQSVIVELKAVETLLPIFTSQLLSYLRMSGLKLGLLINFNVTQLKDGVRRVVNNF
jgi:GxxExxY protein